MNKLISKLKLQKGQSGFTIIEVLIVLAIGALIILAVLLAVPALQKNQANNQRKSEASRVAAAINQYLADANGTWGSDDAATAAIKDIAGVGNNKKLTAVAVGAPAAKDGKAGTYANNTAYIIKDKQCSGTDASTTATGKYAVVYVSEGLTSNTAPSACVNG